MRSSMSAALPDQMPVATSLFERLLGRIYAAYISLVYRTTRWEVHGADDLRAAMKEGPVIYLL